MRVEVNPTSGVIELCAGAQRWPVALDPATGAVHALVESGELVARPLTWREKRILARHAWHGEAFLRRQLVAACCGQEVLATQPEAAWALAAWVNFPAADGVALPFATEAVASVGLALCRSAGWRPRDLDTLDALEVEALWQALAEGDAAAGEAPAGRVAEQAAAVVSLAAAAPLEMQTIRIVPDPAPVDALPSTAPPRAATPPQNADVSASVGTTGAGAAGERPVPSWTPPPAAGMALEKALPNGAAVIDAPAFRRRLAAHLRPALSVSGGAPDAAKATEVSALPLVAGMAQAMPGEGLVLGERSVILPPTLLATTPALEQRTPPAPTASPAPIRLPADSAPLPAATAPGNAVTAVPPAGLPSPERLPSAGSPVMAATAFDLEALIAAFSDRLEQAALDLGVDLEAI